MDDRLDRLEREVAILRAELVKLREQVRTPGMQQAEPRPRPAFTPETPQPNPARPKAPAFEPPPRKPEQSFEQLIGRYGTIAVATITVLVGVGIFLNWAIQHGLLGPTTRVVLGYLAAIGIAIGGMRLRMRGTREFGNVLLALALGVVHLVCWSAGPLLHVLPSTVALAIGFLASVVLAEFALRHDEEALCATGFFGAAIAPFVTNDGSNNVIALAIYGMIVVALSAAALRDRPWRTALNVTIGSFAVYLVVVAAARPSNSAWPGIVSRLGILFPIAVLLAIIPLVHARHRRLLIRVATAAVALGGIMASHVGGDSIALGLTIAAAVIAIGALDAFRPDAVEREDETEVDPLVAKRTALIDALVLPLALFLAAIVATPGARSGQSAAVGVVWAVLAVFMTHRNRAETEGDMYAATAALTSLWIVPALFPRDQPLARILGAIVMGLAMMLLSLRMARQAFIAGGLGSLAIASLWALALLDQRTPFAYVPFATSASIVTIVAIGGWLGARRITQRPEFFPQMDKPTRHLLDGILITATIATAFLWGRAELVGAWSVTASTALLIVYYAASGTLMIWQGRQRRVQALRVIGLLLTLLAAGKALVEAFEVPNVAVRIAVFFAVSVFLLAVAYWYRRGGDELPEPAAT